MCSPKFSFLVDRNGKAYYKDGILSHTQLAKEFGVDEDRVLKGEFDWREGKFSENNPIQWDSTPFQPKQSHNDAADSLVEELFSTADTFIAWVLKNGQPILEFKGFEKILKQQAWAEYEKVKQQAWAEYIRTCIHKFIELFKDPSNRAESWK